MKNKKTKIRNDIDITMAYILIDLIKMILSTYKEVSNLESITKEAYLSLKKGLKYEI